jgi:hypothetical protein
MPRPKVSAKVADGLKRRREFLKELAAGCMSTMVVRIDGNLAFARSLDTDGLITLGQDITSITAAGREWLRHYG